MDLNSNLEILSRTSCPLVSDVDAFKDALLPRPRRAIMNYRSAILIS